MRLSNGLLSIEFDESTGNVRQITGRRTGLRYLNDPRGGPLAKLVVPTPEHMSRPLFSHEAGRPTFSRCDDQLEIVFPELCYHGDPTGRERGVRSLIFDIPLCRLSGRRNRRTGRHHCLPRAVRTSIRRRASRQYRGSRLCPLPLDLLFTSEGQTLFALHLPSSVAGLPSGRGVGTMVLCGA